MELVNIDRLRHLEQLGQRSELSFETTSLKCKSKQMLILEKGKLEALIRQDFLRVCKKFVTDAQCTSFFISYPISTHSDEVNSLSINPISATYKGADGVIQYRFRDGALYKNDVLTSLSEISIFIEIFSQVHMALKNATYKSLRME